MQSGRGKRRRGRAADQASQSSGAPAELPKPAKIEVVDHERDARLLADEHAWERIGRELRLCDPKRYVALLKIAEDCIAIHRDPLGAPIPTGYLLLTRRDRDDFD